MSKADRRKKRQRYAKPSLPRVIGANDNIAVANDNMAPVTIRGVTLTEGQAWRFADAERRIADPDLAVQRSGHRMLEALDREIDARLADRAAAAGLDGLETLLTAGSITRTQHAAGLRYRDDYELLDPEKGLTPPSIDQTRKITRGGDGFAQKRREREEFVRDLEAMIQEEDRTFRGALGRSDVERVGRAVWALREIAGKGANLLALTSSGSSRTAIAEGLIVGLDCAAVAYGLE